MRNNINTSNTRSCWHYNGGFPSKIIIIMANMLCITSYPGWLQHQLQPNFYGKTYVNKWTGRSVGVVGFMHAMRRRRQHQKQQRYRQFPNPKCLFSFQHETWHMWIRTCLAVLAWFHLANLAGEIIVMPSHPLIATRVTKKQNSSIHTNYN